MTSLSVQANVISNATPATSGRLVELANGEYTASSVAADQTDASKLGLRKEKDGNYGTSAPQVATSSASAQSSAGVQAALTALLLGGA